MATVSSRRAELEQILENDIAELAQLQESVLKTHVLTERMGGMLTSFEDRLAKLESSILPIHQSTKHLTKLHENIEKSLEYVDTIVNYLELGAREDIYITKGPTSNDLTAYLTVVSKLKDALTHLHTLEFKSGETASNKLKTVLTKAHFHIHTLFRRKLVALSNPIDIRVDQADAALPRISEHDLEELVLLTGQLAPLDRIVSEGSDVYEHVKEYSSVRGVYLVKSLAPLAASSSASVRTNASTISYVKGSSPFIAYTLYYLRMCKVEKAFIQKLILKPQAQSCFLQTIEVAMEVYSETAESMIARVKRSIQKKEYIDLFMLIDVSSNLAEYLKQYDTVVAYSGNKAHENQPYQTISDFLEEIKPQDPNIPSKPHTNSLPIDGTVHEISSITLNLIRRLLEYEPAVNAMLHEGHGAANLSADNLKQLCKDMLGLLFANLEAKAKGYKRAVLGNVFLMNNFHYVMKQLKSMGPGVLADSEVLFETAFGKQKNAYTTSWTPCYQFLMDTTHIEAGAKALTKPQRETIKDRFKNFNAEIDSMYAIQKGYTIADSELRYSILNGIKDILFPLYVRFLGKYMTIEFTMRDRMGDLKSGANAVAPSGGNDGGPGDDKKNNEKSPRNESAKRAPSKKEKEVQLPPGENGEDSEEMKAFFSEIETVREDIGTVKETISQIQGAHENALNVISEAQSAETTKELERLMDRANGLSSSIRNRLKAMEAANKKFAKQGGRTGDARIRVTQHGAIAKKFLDVMMEYKDIQKKYQDKYKQRMQRQYLIVKPTANEAEIEKMINDDKGPVFAQSIVHQGQKAEAKRALAEIQDRHADVQRIEKSIIELQQLFIDMSVLVAAQGEMINQIEIHVDDAIDQTEQGTAALHKAVKLQKKTRKKMCIIIGLLIAVALIIGLGVYFGIAK
ncbi:Exocyst complex component 7 [Podochytrium sp. JEL0797]|nr:Exocyst complex component 7 [Podochytrium sp. JEL0797]